MKHSILLTVHQVKNIQWCINEVVANGSIETARPIDITKWKTTCYTNIPQQKDKYVLLPKITTRQHNITKVHLYFAAIPAGPSHLNTCWPGMGRG
jgi:hypothetical protein